MPPPGNDGCASHRRRRTFCRRSRKPSNRTAPVPARRRSSPRRRRRKHKPRPRPHSTPNSPRRLMSNNIFRGYTLSNNFPSVTGTVEATYSIFFASVNGASVQIPELSHFQLTNTIGLRPTFGKLTVESGFAYYSYPTKRARFVLRRDVRRADLRGHAKAHAWAEYLLRAELLPLRRLGELQCRQRQIRFRPRPHFVRRTWPPELRHHRRRPRRSSCPTTSTVMSARPTPTTRCHSICASMGRRCRDKAAF